jgi:predicted nucleotidyltransferase
MAGWKQTAKQFLEQWINQDYVEGAILTGSRVTKFHDSHSDIEVMKSVNHVNKPLWKLSYV